MTEAASGATALGSRAPSTAIVLATRDRVELLSRTLDSLADCRIPAALNEVLVVENGGRFGAQRACSERRGRLPLRHLFHPEGKKSEALNLALRETEAELVVFFDDDVQVAEGTLEAYVEAGNRYGPGYHFGGPLKVEREEDPPEWLRSFLPPTSLGWYHGDEERYYDRPHFIGSNWAGFRRDMLSVGGFAEHLGPGNESGALGDEMEIQQRMLDAGNRGVYLPDAVALHWVPGAHCTFEWARRRQYRMGVTRGLIGEDASVDGPRLAGAPLARWRDCLEYGCKVLFGRALGWSEQRRVYPEMRLQETWGRVVGSRLARGREVSLEDRAE